jgi:hypothetical protein
VIATVGVVGVIVGIVGVMLFTVGAEVGATVGQGSLRSSLVDSAVWRPPWRASSRTLKELTIHEDQLCDNSTRRSIYSKYYVGSG